VKPPQVRERYMFFKNRSKSREDLNRKVERYKRWWQDSPADSSLERSKRLKKDKTKGEPFDSSFVYHEES
jgi:hypothetical protein